MERGAHPRSRGENEETLRPRTFAGGSSPLTRGKREAGGEPGERGRLIPAHAGKTGRPRDGRRVGQAHPRSRGENGVKPLAEPLDCGSSPLTRGKPLDGTEACEQGGLIPAHAGKTPSSCNPSPTGAAHPRSRGENFAAAIRCGIGKGSSPLTRGKQCNPLPHLRLARLIPAHAGKTARQDSDLSSLSAHPRSRGENTRTRRGPMAQAGSSPLTRGKHRSDHIPWRAGGLIPAHAGKTAACLRRKSRA